MLNKEYYESFIEFWMPIYKKQIFKARIQNDLTWLIDIQCNIWKNWNMNIHQKNEILKELGIKKIK